MDVLKKPAQTLLKIILGLLLCVPASGAFAQQSKSDSILILLKKGNAGKGIDSAAVKSALKLITNSVLKDSDIPLIEKAGDAYKHGNDEDIPYLVKFNILVSLSTSDKIKAIQYGRFHLKTLEASKTPHAEILRSAFYRQLRIPYRNSDRLPEGLMFYTEKLNSFKLRNDSLGLSDSYYVLAGFYRTTGLMDQAIYNMKKSVSYLDSSKTTEKKYFDLSKSGGRFSWNNNMAVIGDYYLLKGEYEECIKYIRIALMHVKINKDITFGQMFGIRNLALAKLYLNQLDSVDYYLKIAGKALGSQTNYQGEAVLMQINAFYKTKIGALTEAELMIQRCWRLIETQNLPANSSAGIIAPDYYLALVRVEQGRYKDAIELLKKDIIRVRNVRPDVLRDYKLLGELYQKTGDDKQAIEAYQSFLSLQDSVLADQNKYRTISFETEQQMSENEISIARLQGENKISSLSRNFSIGIAVLLLIIAAGVYHRFRSKKKANLVLEETLANLKSAQSQLVQAEKMASLGELTAGIAHEIQNPLNFVNNFSDVNVELIQEMREEIEKGNLDEAKAISKDIRDNELKINHHGKRADAIVKGMLQHSRSSNGLKVPTNINALADEYLRLAYHGLRAKDKSFNASLKTDFDESIGEINIIPQDMGRVILNLITNAFYACNEKKQQAAHQNNINPNSKENSYEPLVTISTRKPNGRLVLTISDNGNGIPQKVLEKIFQPFFTTKPSGEGTGLGLSMSFDIVKSHGGEINVDTKEGEGSKFMISIPLDNN